MRVAAVLAATIGWNLAAEPASTRAQDAPVAETALDAGINVTRRVPYRPATRLGLPASPFRVRTTPAPEVLGFLAEGRVVTRILSDSEAAQIRVGTPLRSVQGGFQTIDSGAGLETVRGTPRTNLSGAGMPGVRSIGGFGIAAGGVVRSATGVIGSTINGALGLTTQ